MSADCASSVDMSGLAITPGIKHVLPGEYEYEGDTYAECFPQDLVARIRDFEFRDDDVVLVSYPKTGTHWMQEIVYLVHNEGKVRLTDQSSKDKMPFLEMRRPPGQKPSMDALADQDSPRLIKSHQGIKFFRKPLENTSTKFIVLMRNARDTLVSYYHFYRSCAFLGNFTGTFEEFFEMFKAKKLAQGDWFDFVKGWHDQKDNPNCCFFKYETMKADLPSQVRRLAVFMGKNLSDDVIADICQQVSLESMKSNPRLNGSKTTAVIDPKIAPLIRKGAVGDWKNHFSSAMQNEFDSIYEREMTGVDIDFEH